MDLWLAHFMQHRIDRGAGKLIYKNGIIVVSKGINFLSKLITKKQWLVAKKYFDIHWKMAG